MNKKILLAAVLLLCVLCSFRPTFADEIYNSAVAAYRESRFQEAFGLLQQAIARDRNNADAYYVMAMTCQQLGKFSEARGYYQFIVDHFPASKAAPLAKKGVQALASVKATTPPPPGHTIITATAATAAAAVKGSVPTKTEASAGDIIPDEEYVPYDREHGDKLFVSGALNGRRTKMLIDTGAYTVCVGKNMLTKLGIKPPEGKATGVAGGASGAMATWKMDLDVSVGKIKIRVNADVIDEEDMILLGQPFLSKMHYQIDSAHNYIHFTKIGGKTTTHVPYGTIDVPFKMIDGSLIVEGSVNGIPCEMNFDTGASTCLFSVRDLMRLRLQPNSEVYETSVGGVGGGSVRSLLFTVPSIELGPISKRDVIVHVSAIGGGGYPLLGQSFFGNSRFVVDNEKKVIHFYR